MNRYKVILNVLNPEAKKPWIVVNAVTHTVLKSFNIKEEADWYVWSLKRLQEESHA
jgi:hypothetical protein